MHRLLSAAMSRITNHFLPPLSIFNVLCTFLLFTRYTNSYIADYAAFDSCGINGWSCRRDSIDYEVTYDCSGIKKNTRVWAWTARLPKDTTIFSVINCNTVEVHFDCTAGFRPNPARTFQCINVTTLQVLAPMRPGVFLHDNDMFPQAPAELVFRNIKRINMNSVPLFKKSESRKCTKVPFNGLTMESIEQYELGPGSSITTQGNFLKDVHLLNVTFTNNGIRSGAIDINSERTVIVKCDFQTIDSKAISINGSFVSISHSKIKSLSSNAIKIRGRNFVFQDNYIGNIDGDAFDVFAQEVNLVMNTFENVRKGAFENIKPGVKSDDYEIYRRFSYNFSKNIIKKLEKNSLPPHESYEHTCDVITLDENSIDCNCSMNVWAPKFSFGFNNKFYKNLLEIGNNKCNGKYANYQMKCIWENEMDNCTKFDNLVTLCSPVVQPLDFTIDEQDPFDFTTPETTITTEREWVTIINASRPNAELKNEKVESHNGVIISIIGCVSVVSIIAALFIVFYYRRKKFLDSASHSVYHVNSDCRIERDVLIEDHDTPI